MLQRRGVVHASWAVALLAWSSSETVPLLPRGASASEPPNGLFRLCPDRTPCVSSQDDRPRVWDNPWAYDGSEAEAMRSLRAALVRRDDATVLETTPRYVRAAFASRSPLGAPRTDVIEWYLTPGDALIQFRAERLGGDADLGANRERLEKLRIQLGFEKVPVLRNRRRALIVIESPLDTFGPAEAERDALGFTPSERTPSESPYDYRDADPFARPWAAPDAQMRERRAADAGEALKSAWLRESDDRVRSR